MPLSSYTPRVKPQGYDLINQAFNRFVAGQIRPVGGGIQGGGGGEGQRGAGGDAQFSGGGGQQQPSFQNGPQQPQNNQQPQVPDFFNQQQNPAYQAPQGSTAAGGPTNYQAPAGQQQNQGQQGMVGNLGQMLALLGPLQQGPGGFLPGIFSGMEKPYWQKPQMFPSLLQQQAGQYGNVQGTPLEALFNPQSYGGHPQSGFGLRSGMPRGDGQSGIGLNPQVQSQALAYILSQLAQGGMPPQGGQGA